MFAGVKLNEGEEMISFDVSSLYTNVPVIEAIETCADLLYSGWVKKKRCIFSFFPNIFQIFCGNLPKF